MLSTSRAYRLRVIRKDCHGLNNAFIVSLVGLLSSDRGLTVPIDPYRKDRAARKGETVHHHVLILASMRPMIRALALAYMIYLHLNLLPRMGRHPRSACHATQVCPLSRPTWNAA